MQKKLFLVPKYKHLLEGYIVLLGGFHFLFQEKYIGIKKKV
jgi:hypothetical protein